VKLEIQNLRFAYKPSNTVLKDVDMQASPGAITALIGPNAAGKSTLLKCVAGILRPMGRILLDGKEIRELKKRDVARYVTYLPQENPSRAFLTVFEAVLLGRLQTLSWRVSDDDLAVTLRVLEDLGIEELAPRFLDELSGGQKQMVSIAQALVREPKILLLDEPTASLDLQHELEILDLLGDIAREREITTIIAMHDLNLAARYSDKLIVLKDGEVHASGEPKVVLTPEMVRFVYGVNAKISTDDGTVQISPINSIRNKARPDRRN